MFGLYISSSAIKKCDACSSYILLQTFLLLVYMLKTKTFCTSHHKMLKTKTFFTHLITKPLVSTLEFKNFDSILQKNSETPTKTE